MRGGAPRLAGVGQDRDDIEFRSGAARDVEYGFVVPHPRWADVPQHPLLKVDQVVNPDSRRFGQHRPLLCDGDVDGQRVSSESGFEAQGGRSSVKHCGPRPLRPGQRSGVVDIDAYVHPSPLVASEQSPNLVLSQARIQGLPTRDHSVLPAKHMVNVHRLDTGGPP